MSETDLLEAERLRRLRQLRILDTPGDEFFRTLVEHALEIVPGTDIAAVSLIDTDRQWFKAIVGLELKETPRSVSFCAHTIHTESVLVVPNATDDARFARNPLVTGSPRIRFYAGVKLAHGVGALCVIGREPRQITKAEIEKLSKLAKFANIQLSAHGALRNLPGLTSH